MLHRWDERRSSPSPAWQITGLKGLFHFSGRNSWLPLQSVKANETDICAGHLSHLSLALLSALHNPASFNPLFAGISLEFNLLMQPLQLWPLCHSKKESIRDIHQMMNCPIHGFLFNESSLEMVNKRKSLCLHSLQESLLLRVRGLWGGCCTSNRAVHCVFTDL